MKTTPCSVWQRCLPVLIFFALAVPLRAQPVAPPQIPENSKSAGDASEIVELSPFVVSAEKDTGYQAASTLAGTRLNTAVADIAASVSIYTKDFIEDVGANNLNELMIFATGMEAGGEGGNYFGGNNDMFAENLTVGSRASSVLRTRGFSSPTLTRGYFATNIPADRYSTDSVTVIRGPNAALFGVGEPAGVVESAPILANLTRNRGNTRLRFGDTGSVRFTADINVILMPKKLALRVAKLNENEKYEQKPAFEKKDRVYASLLFEPTRTTTIRARYETGFTEANRPILALPYNSVSDAWYDAGRPSFDWRYYDDPAMNPNARTQASQSFEPNTMSSTLFADVIVVYANAGDAAPANAFSRAPGSTSGTDPNRIKNQLFHPQVNRDLAADTMRFLRTANIFDLPTAYWTGTNVPEGQQSGYKPTGILRQGFGDFSVFDFKDRMIDETSRQGDNFKTYNISLEQRAWKNRVGIELAYDRQDYSTYAKNSFFGNTNANHIFIDTNVTLPTGEPNPNLGRPFAVFGQTPWQQSHERREGMRATGYLRYDFRDISATWGKWLGAHTLTGLYEYGRVTSVNYSYRLALSGAASEALNAGPLNDSNRQARAIIYMGPSIIGNDNALTLEPIKSVPVAGPTVPVAYFSRAANATDPGRFVEAPASFTEVLHSGNAQRDVIKSEAFVLHSHWLQGNVVTMLAWRRDRSYFISEQLEYIVNPNDRNDPGKVHYDLGDFSFPSTPPHAVTDDNLSAGVVVHWPKQWGKLPLGSQLSVFFNKSSNFTPLVGRVDPFGNTLASPEGNTREYGVNLSLFKNKFAVRMNVFKTSMVGAPFQPTFLSAAVSNAVIQRAAAWLQNANTNQTMDAQRQRDVELLFSVLPDNFRDLYNFKVSGEPPNRVVTSRTGNLSGLSDSTDYVARGLEMDIIFNPTSNARIALNVTKQQTVRSNSIPVMKNWIETMTPVWDQLRHVPNGNYPEGHEPGDTLAPNVQTYGDWLDANVIAPFINTIAQEGVANAEQRKWRVNLVGSYTFGRGSIFGDKLRGWMVGGSVRWQDKVAIGYPSTRDEKGLMRVDVRNPFYGPTETNINAFLSYSRSIWKNKVRMTIRLDVQNLIRGDDLIPVRAQGWNGEVAMYRLSPPRKWYLECMFAF